MKIKHGFDILALGLSSGWSLGFLVLLLQSLTSQDFHPII
jgi:hypothetical protein